MSDLISRSALKEEIEGLCMTITGLRAGKGILREFMNEYRKSVLRTIDEQPTVDAVPVAYGEWIPNESTFYVCSVCDSEAYWDTDYGQQLFDYCPYCGAKMDGT